MICASPGLTGNSPDTAASFLIKCSKLQQPDAEHVTPAHNHRAQNHKYFVPKSYENIAEDYKQQVVSILACSNFQFDKLKWNNQ